MGVGVPEQRGVPARGGDLPDGVEAREDAGPEPVRREGPAGKAAPEPDHGDGFPAARVVTRGPVRVRVDGARGRRHRHAPHSHAGTRHRLDHERGEGRPQRSVAIRHGYRVENAYAGRPGVGEGVVRREPPTRQRREGRPRRESLHHGGGRAREHPHPRNRPQVGGHRAARPCRQPRRRVEEKKESVRENESLRSARRGARLLVIDEGPHARGQLPEERGDGKFPVMPPAAAPPQEHALPPCRGCVGHGRLAPAGSPRNRRPLRRDHPRRPRHPAEGAPHPHPDPLGNHDLGGRLHQIDHREGTR